MSILFAVVFFRIAESEEAIVAKVLPVLLPLLSPVVDPLSEPLSDPLATMLQDHQAKQTKSDHDKIFHHASGFAEFS
jgi:hypothetical protein